MFKTLCNDIYMGYVEGQFWGGPAMWGAGGPVRPVARGGHLPHVGVGGEEENG